MGGRQGSPCQNAQKRLNEAGQGEVAEWLNAPVSKTGMGRSPSRVRIPPSPPPPNAAERFFGACVGGRRIMGCDGAECLKHLRYLSWQFSLQEC